MGRKIDPEARESVGASLGPLNLPQPIAIVLINASETRRVGVIISAARPRTATTSLVAKRERAAPAKRTYDATAPAEHKKRFA
jgi:hypothetical protein